jgi:hypothetical protein
MLSTGARRTVGATNVTMRTTAIVVSIVLLSLLLILFGVAATALVLVWPPLGLGALAAGIGARLLHETRNQTP